MALSVYCMVILIQIYRLQQNNPNKQSSQAVKLSLIAASIWMVTGLGDALTGIQIVDLPPLTWVGSFLVTCSIAWILIFHIDNLYEDRRLLSNRLMYDHLTQAFSRSYFEIRLSEAIQEMQQSDSNKLYLCIFDIDNFKKVNDSYGHANGDQLLKQIATITINAIQPKDCFARLGGDEFILLLIGRQKDDQATAVIENIRKHIAETSFGVAPYDFNASCSFGMVKSGPEHLKVKDLENQLLSHADQALYSSKHKGKNTISVSTLAVP
ncbi:GGDEF domain-containing protein [Psychromonas sp. KJ10-10]|uniref:GGDEF domain-containing protein n=1 Tax=Psychromonas sp. KJ10-10 TaxID=3391823 RepID=UPI0039B5B556